MQKRQQKFRIEKRHWLFCSGIEERSLSSASPLGRCTAYLTRAGYALFTLQLYDTQFLIQFLVVRYSRFGLLPPRRLHLARIDMKKSAIRERHTGEDKDEIWCWRRTKMEAARSALELRRFKNKGRQRQPGQFWPLMSRGRRVAGGSPLVVPGPGRGYDDGEGEGGLQPGRPRRPGLKKKRRDWLVRAAGGHSSKELFEQHIYLLFGIST
jgi:hypothetical protein